MVSGAAVRAGVLAWAMLAGTANPTFAAGPLQLRPGMTGVADIGSGSCEMFNEMHYNGPSGMRHNVLTWLQGYVFARTGASLDALLARQPAGREWSFDSLTDVFVDYCQANPEALVSDAAVSVWTVLTEQ